MKPLLLLLLLATSLDAAAVRKPVVQDDKVIRTKQQDAELKGWIIGLQKENKLNEERADMAEAATGRARGLLQQAQGQADTLQTEVNIVTDDRNAQAAMKDKAMSERDYWHTKHGEAVKKLWWWRLWAGGAILVGVLLIAGGLLTRFTKWGAATLGPLVKAVV